jgi:hypothetical protein
MPRPFWFGLACFGLTVLAMAFWVAAFVAFKIMAVLEVMS